MVAFVTDLCLRKSFPSIHIFCFLPSLGYEQLFFFYALLLQYICAFSAIKCFPSALCCCLLGFFFFKFEWFLVAMILYP